MAKPVNDITGDAPDSTNPDKKYVPEKEGKFKYTPPPPPKPDPRDAEIFTEEKLRRSGGKMKEPPMGLDSKKHGGSIKARRFAIGGEMMDEYNGAMGRGTDTPDKKIAREKSDAAYESDAADKAAGLKASKGEDVGFFKRLMMGNIDKPGSEAYEKLGAGRGRADAAREDANKSARNERENARTREANMALDENTPAPVKTKPSVDNNPIATGYTNRLEKEERNAETELTSAERANAMRPNRVAATVKPTVNNPKVSEKEKVSKYEDFTPQPASQSFKLESKPVSSSAVTSSANTRKVEATKAGEIPGQADDVKAPANTGEDTSGPSNFGRIASGLGVGASLAGLGLAARTAGHADRYAKAAKETAEVFKTATDANNARKAAIAAKRVTDAADIRKATQNPDMARRLAESAARSKAARAAEEVVGNRRGGSIKAYASGGSVSASSRGDGCAQRGKTRGTMR